MARNEIGPLNVRVSADTREFVSGMANVQRRMEQTTAVLQKSRQAFGGLGSAMRMPGFGRGAALGGAASGVAGALGLGAIGGGVAGLSVAAGYIAVDRITTSIRANEERRLKIQQDSIDAINAQAEAYEEQRQKMNAANAAIDAAIRGNVGANQDQLEKLNLIGAELERLRDLRRRVGFNPLNLDYGTTTQEIDKAIEDAREALRRITNEINGVSTNGLGNRLTNALSRNVDRGSIGDIFTSLAVAGREARDAAAERAQEERLTANAIRDAVADWKRENQRSSDMLATTVGRISSQITQLTFRSD